MITYCDFLEISPTNDFYEISVPVTLPYMRGIYLQYPSDIVGIFHAYTVTKDIVGIYHAYTVT